jgi:hypothetical protein
MNVRARIERRDAPRCHHGLIFFVRFPQHQFRSMHQDSSADSFRSFLECVVNNLFQHHLNVHRPDGEFSITTKNMSWARSTTR